DLARRIAAEGYAAALVDLFAREGDLPAGVQPPTRVPTPEDRARMGPAMDRGAKVSDEQAMGDLQAAVDELRRRGAPRVVIWGFCSGGRLAYVAAARLRGLSGAVAYYGFLKAEPPRAAPLDIADKIKAPRLGGWDVGELGKNRIGECGGVCGAVCSTYVHLLVTYQVYM